MAAFGTADGVAVDGWVGTSSSLKRLVFQSQPVGSTSGSPLSEQPVVRALNGSGSTDSSFTGVVTMSLIGVGGLSGGIGISASSGVATFTDLVITGAGVSNLVASAAGYLSATSEAVTTA